MLDDSRLMLPAWLAPALVVWATLFNALLAIVNAHGVTLTPAAVGGAEALATAAALLLAVQHFRPEMKPWFVLIALILLIFSLQALARGDLPVKNVRDVLIIPTYILLGLAAPRRYFTATVCLIHAVVIAVGLFEALDTDGYAKLFDVQSYYINTRGYDDENFWNKQSELFVSAVRPGDRVFLPFLNLHRLSSVFLEPVSLGNYCTVITAFICARFGELGLRTLLFLVVGNILVLIGCDGRLAGLTSLAIVAAALIAPFMPRGAAVLYLPVTLIAAFTATLVLGLDAGPDDLSGRIAHTVELLLQFDLEDLFGLSDRYIWVAVDSGIAYLLITQTIVGFLLIWSFVVFAASEDRRDAVRFSHGAVIYLSLAMMVSFSFLTIKTAALLWFMQGVFQRREPLRAASPPAGLARPLRRPHQGRRTAPAAPSLEGNST